MWKYFQLFYNPLIFYIIFASITLIPSLSLSRSLSFSFLLSRSLSFSFLLSHSLSFSFLLSCPPATSFSFLSQFGSLNLLNASSLYLFLTLYLSNYLKISFSFLNNSSLYTLFSFNLFFFYYNNFLQRSSFVPVSVALLVSSFILPS